MNVEHDLAMLAAMAAEMPDYLLANVLFWQMQAASSFPKLSLGAWLLRSTRLQAVSAQFSTDQATAYETASRQAAATLGQWRVAAENKAAQELHARLNLWRNYLADSEADRQAGRENYAHAVTQRVIAALLIQRFEPLAATAEATGFSHLDRQLRGRWQSGAFVWAAELQPAFHPSEFWYLYGELT